MTKFYEAIDLCALRALEVLKMEPAQRSVDLVKRVCKTEMRVGACVIVGKCVIVVCS